AGPNRRSGGAGACGAVSVGLVLLSRDGINVHLVAGWVARATRPGWAPRPPGRGCNAASRNAWPHHAARRHANAPAPRPPEASRATPRDRAGTRWLARSG